MARRKVPPAILAARQARLEGISPIVAEAACITEQIEEAERAAIETPIDTFWQGPDTMNDPPTYLSSDSEDDRIERTPKIPRFMVEHMSRAPKPHNRESKVFRLRQAQRICTLISQGQTLQQICGTNGLPSIVVVNHWLDENDKFQTMYRRARLRQADYLADEMLLLATIVRKDPKNHAAYRVSADIMRWQSSVRAPHKYGDTKHIEITEVRKTPQQIQREIIDLAAEFNVPIADLPANVTPIRRTGTDDITTD